MGKDLRVKVRLTADTKDAERNIGKAEGSFKRFGSFLKQRFVITLGDVSRAISGVFAAIQQSVTLERQEVALRGQLAAMGKDFDTFIGTLKKVSNNTVATADLIASSSRALLLGIPAEEIDDLLQIAASRAAATGESVAKAFNDISVGIGRASPLILDNLGFTIKLEDAFGELAKQLGKTTGELTSAEQKMAVLNAVLKEGKDTADQFGRSLNDTGTALEQSTAAMTNFKNEANVAVAAIGTGFAAVLTRATAGFVGMAAFVQLAISKIQGLIALIPGLEEKFGELSKATFKSSIALERKFKEMIKSADALSASADKQAAKFLGLASAQDEAAKSAENLAGKLDDEKESLQGVGDAAKSAAEKSQALIDVNRGIAETAEEAKEGVKDLTTVLEEQAPAVGQLTLANERLLVILERLATVPPPQTAQPPPPPLEPLFGGGSIRARTASNQARVDEALRAGNRPMLFGTRIKTLDGGSVLIDGVG